MRSIEAVNSTRITGPSPPSVRLPWLPRFASTAWGALLGLPTLMLVGLLVVAGGTLFDIWAHWSAGDLSPVFTRLTFTERLGHWIVLAGMLISLSGVIARGYRPPAGERPDRARPHHARRPANPNGAHDPNPINPNNPN